MLRYSVICCILADVLLLYYYYYYYRLDFTPIKKCNELDELVMPICLLFDIPISAENFTRQMMEISGVM